MTLFQNPEKARSNNYTDSLHLVALEAFLAQINAKNYGAEYQLKPYQCDFKEDTIQKLYSAIAADTNVVLVIDNTWGRHIRHAAETIKGQIPVIATTADQNQLDFGNNAVFLDPNDPQPFYLIKFIQSVLEAKRIGFITETDYLLHHRFSALIKENNLPCDTLIQLLQSRYVNNNEVPKDYAEALERNLQTSKSVGAAFVDCGIFGDDVFYFWAVRRGARNLTLLKKIIPLFRLKFTTFEAHFDAVDVCLGSGLIHTPWSK